MNYSEIFVLHCLWLFGVKETDKYPLNMISLNRDLDWEVGKVLRVACWVLWEITYKFKQTNEKQEQEKKPQKK